MEERLAGARERILLATRRLVAAGGYRNAPVTAVAARREAARIRAILRMRRRVHLGLV